MGDLLSRALDLGTLDAQGQLRVTGRTKDIIIRKGENISAAEVENVLYTIEGVANAAVIGLADADRGERVCAVLEVADGATPPTFDAVFAACREAGLMTQKIPEQVVIHEGPLPRNATMKILKYELRDQYQALPWP